jgi:DNA repair exonuclease SbcCD ATPase subunit
MSFSRPSSAPHGAPDLTSTMVSQFSTIHLQRPATHRDPRLGVERSQQSEEAGGQEGRWREEMQEEEHEHEEEEEQQHDDHNHSHSSAHEAGHEESHFESSHRDDRAEEEEDGHRENTEGEAEDDGNFPVNSSSPSLSLEDDFPDDSPSGGTRRTDRVRVAVRCRPMLSSEETTKGSGRSCVLVRDSSIILASSRVFSFDYAFGGDETQEDVYRRCAQGMVKAAFQGYNATIFAYGQTGSGKTFSMGSGNNTGLAESQLGIIPRAVRDIFALAAKAKGEVRIKATYLEIYQEELIDLLHPSSSKTTPITIREEANGGVVLLGAREEQIANYEAMMRILTRGSVSRTTGSTKMNEHSSRSHSIFTITIEQRLPSSLSTNHAIKAEVTRSKFHLVDLAGSERAKRTQATGQRFKESIHINKGLLALGNVIQALSTSAAGSRHIPYRESKLTRLLQGALGGNSRTLMVACCSPSDRNFEETHTTLKYASRARAIRNAAVVNTKTEVLPIVQQAPEVRMGEREREDLGRMKEEIERLQAQLQQEARRREVEEAEAQQEEEEEGEDQNNTSHRSARSHRSTHDTALSDPSSSLLSSLRHHHSHLLSRYSSLHLLFSSLHSEHAWLLSGMMFFVRCLGEWYGMEGKRDEAKERVIALRKEYDALQSSSAPSSPSSSSHLSSLASEIKAAQKSYITYRDCLSKLREDLEGFLSIYTLEKCQEMKQRKWMEEGKTPEEVEREMGGERGEQIESSPSTTQLQYDLAQATSSLSSLQSEFSSVSSALALAQEDLKYDDEIFEEKIRVIKELTGKEREAREQVEQWKEANRKLTEMMKAMGEEVRKKLGAKETGSLTSRSALPSARAPLSARSGFASPLSFPSPRLDSTPIQPDFHRSTHALAREQEERDEMQTEEREEEEEEGGEMMSRGGMRPGTAAVGGSPTSRLSSQHSDLERLKEEYSALLSHLTEMHARHGELLKQSNTLASDMSTRKSQHMQSVRSEEKSVRDRRIQVQMKRQAVSEAAAVAMQSTKSPTQQLKEAETHYASLEQELSLKHRLLSALSPRALSKADPKRNVRSGIELEVRELEQQLKQAGEQLETLQLGASGGAAARSLSSPSSSSPPSLSQLESELHSLEAALEQLEQDVHERESRYHFQKEEDKQIYAHLQSSLAEIEKEVEQAEQRVEELRREILQREEAIARGEHTARRLSELSSPDPDTNMSIQITSASGNKRSVRGAAASPEKQGGRGQTTALTPASPAQTQTLKRKTQWLNHQVSTFLQEEASMLKLQAEQQERRRLEEEKEKVTKQKNKLIEQGLRASQNMSGIHHTAPKEDLNASLHHIDTALHTINVRSSSLLLRKSHAGTASNAATKQLLSNLQREFDDMQMQREILEAQRQSILSQLANKAPPNGMRGSASMADGEILDGSILDALSEEERDRLRAMDEQLDDLALESDYKSERIAEMSRTLQQSVSFVGTNGLASARRPATAAVQEEDASEVAPDVLDLSSHREAFLSKALSMFDPQDPAEAQFLVRELVESQLSRVQTEQQAKEKVMELQEQVEERERRLTQLEAQLAAVAEEGDARVAAAEAEWAQKLAAVQSATASSKQNISPPQGYHHLSVSSVQSDFVHSSMSKSPVLKLKHLKSHIQARASQSGVSETSGREQPAASATASSSMSTSSRMFQPHRTFTPANLPLSVHTPLLYNQSPSVTPKSSLGASYNELSPLRSLRQSQMGGRGDGNTDGSITNSSQRGYQAQLSPSTQRLRQAFAEARSASTSQLHSPASTASSDAPATTEGKRAQLSLLKKKQILRASAVEAPPPQQHQAYHARHDDHDHDDDEGAHDDEDPEDDFADGDNFLSARASAPSQPVSKLKGFAVPQLNFGAGVRSNNSSALPSPNPPPHQPFQSSAQRPPNAGGRVVSVERVIDSQR